MMVSTALRSVIHSEMVQESITRLAMQTMAKVG